MKFLEYYDRPTGGLRTSNIRRNNAYFDPAFILNGTASVDAATATIEATQFLMYSSGDPSYVANQFDPGVNMGKTAAGNVFLVFPNVANNAAVIGSDASMPASIQHGWRYYLPLSGVFTDSNWLLSVILLNPSTGLVNVQVGVRLWYGSNASIGLGGAGQYLMLFSLTSPQYCPTQSFQVGATTSIAVVFSVSVSGAGPLSGSGTAYGGTFILSGQYFYEEWFMKVTTASSKSGTTVKVLTNG